MTVLERFEAIMEYWCSEDAGFRCSGGMYEFFQCEIEESWTPGYDGPDITPYISYDVIASGSTLEEAVDAFYEARCHTCRSCDVTSFNVHYICDRRHSGGGYYSCSECL